jgi:hypothetical protein|tara:strand:- start:4174 stop:4806 length:633 start_codon:yes stop_codon:yes gene_type:complete
MRLTNYHIIIFNNHQKRKVLYTSTNYRNITRKYKQILKKSNVIFPIKLSRKKECVIELALICQGNCQDKTIQRRDDLGRLETVSSTNPDFSILDINDFELEEKVYDHQRKKRRHIQEIIEEYVPQKNIVQIFKLNNKLVIQNNDQYFLFSLKTVKESDRLLECLRSHFRSVGKFNCLFSKDLSTIHRKELYNILENYGFDRKLLYKHYTY